MINWINVSKGIGIILVVIGHFNPNFAPAYWTQINDFIYSFHMPFFFLISGYLYQNHKASYSELIKKKFHRLVIPFFFVALIYFVIKLIAQQFVAISYPVDSAAIWALFTNPLNSFVPILWFVHSLVGIFLLYPILRLFLNAHLIVIFTLVIATILKVNQVELPVLKNVIAFIPYFSLGVLMNERFSASEIKEIGKLNIALFLLLLTVSSLYGIEVMQSNYFWISYMDFIPAILGGLLLIASAVLIEQKFNTYIISRIGLASMSIYLLHPIFESAARVMLSKYMQLPFLLIASMSVLAGVLIPNMIEVFLIRRSALLSRFILGIKPINNKVMHS